MLPPRQASPTIIPTLERTSSRQQDDRFKARFPSLGADTINTHPLPSNNTLSPTPTPSSQSRYSTLTPTTSFNHHHHIHNKTYTTMCDYTQREYSCGHFRWIASKWCRDYTLTHKRCQPNVTHFEYRAEELCGECKPKEYPPWENLIKRPKQQTY